MKEQHWIDQSSDEIILELLSRKGFYSWWRAIDEETQTEIREKFSDIIHQNFLKSTDL